MAYNFDRVIDTEKYTIGIDSKANYGYFEHKIYGEDKGGGLWFCESSCQLVDYDGVSALPKQVKDALNQEGRIQDDVMDNF